MPSDHAASAMTRALEAIAAPMEAFGSALALTAEEVRGFLETHRDPEGDEPMRVAAELGPFASVHIDADRFASLVHPQQPLDAEVLHDAEKGLSGLLALRDRGQELHVVRVPTGGDLVQAVRDALSEAGRAFGLTRAIRFVRNGTEAEHAPSSDPFPFHLWSASERSLAPPLVVEVDGGDLRVSGLGDVLEGSQKLVLLVRGPAPPAPLARLVRPGLFVVQTTDGTGLEEIANFKGPAVGAILPDGAAVFTHDPRRGSSYSCRLVVESIPAGDDQKAIGVLPAESIVGDLAHLRELMSAGNVEAAPAAAPEPPAALSPDSPPPPSDSAGRLAGWLLDQAGI